MFATDSSGKLLIGLFLAFGSFSRRSHLGLTREPSLVVEAFPPLFTVQCDIEMRLDFRVRFGIRIRG